MRHPKLSVPLLAGALLLGGVTACSEEQAPAEQLELDEGEITPGYDPGEEPVLEQEEAG